MTTATQTLSELQLQSACFQWAWNTYPRTRMLLFHIPNGGSRNRIEATQLKSAGVVSGVHDLLFYWKGQLYWFELKVGTNKQSPQQIAFGATMLAQGAILHEIRSFEQFQEIFKQIVEPIGWQPGNIGLRDAVQDGAQKGGAI